ncbi:thioredoxin reductase [Deinobacterium chartae]|uniref:Thioredoxin reductase n=1 Tax=Deinobacterium chartae TaxID=521158 RepID=A0A841HZQ6_9DEIO|nr:NAD(P)-binding domain-containing protein [Deinobacterium chartae]MBB6097362.1 thioredoxin reductase [Deinobacterium chartae]
MTQPLPTAIIGAGPIGLAAAAHLLARGETPIILEAGPEAAASVRQWGHVRLFSPWSYLTDAPARALLEERGWVAPPDQDYPSGAELVERYLEPLSRHPRIAPHLHLERRVTGVARLGFDKMKTQGRENAPFVLTTAGPHGPERFLARAVIDASGTWRTPNPLGASGVAAAGEKQAAERLFYGIPDVLGAQRERYAGQHTLVVGSGHSAMNALLDLVQLAAQAPGTRVTWALRRANPDSVYGGGANDQLSERGALGQRLRHAVDAGLLNVRSGFRADTVEQQGAQLSVHSGAQRIDRVDRIIVATGFRPDLEMLRELRLDLDPATESPRALAPLIDPNVHSCGTVRPHGALELQQPEPGFYIVGMKSYGRAPTFLMLTGYEQVRSVVAELTGDRVAARDVQLVLPETGVCSVDSGGGCCAATPAGVSLEDFSLPASDPPPFTRVD